MTKAILLEIAKVDVQRVIAGYRASKVIGNSVLNDESETIGKIDVSGCVNPRKGGVIATKGADRPL